MSLKLKTSKNNLKSNFNTEYVQIDVFKTLEAENCGSNNPIYEITYNQISRKWLVCNSCSELDFFKTNIKEKVRIQA